MKTRTNYREDILKIAIDTLDYSAEVIKGLKSYFFQDDCGFVNKKARDEALKLYEELKEKQESVLQNKIKILKSQENKLKQNLNDKTSAIRKITADNLKKQVDVDSLKEENNQKDKQVSTLTAESLTMSKKIKSLEDELKKSKMIDKANCVELDRLRAKIKDNEITILQANSLIDEAERTYKERLSVLQKEINSNQIKMNDASDVIKNLNRLNQNLKISNSEQIQHLTKSNHHLITSHSEQIKNLKQTYEEEINKLNGELSKKQSMAEAELTRLSSELSANQKLITVKEQVINTKDKDIALGIESKNLLKEELSKAIEEIATIKKDYDLIVKMNRMLAGGSKLDDIMKLSPKNNDQDAKKAEYYKSKFLIVSANFELYKEKVNVFINEEFENSGFYFAEYVSLSSEVTKINNYKVMLENLGIYNEIFELYRSFKVSSFDHNLTWEMYTKDLIQYVPYIIKTISNHAKFMKDMRDRKKHK